MNLRQFSETRIVIEDPISLQVFDLLECAEQQHNLQYLEDFRHVTVQPYPKSNKDTRKYIGVLSESGRINPENQRS
ncbi:hypothetical protein RB195_005679 [Necator americanus]|uniref:Ras-associating domain-containing protein n=1 Tax=Necator americanus TaxID=51031 RepID=A0ABR1BP20_NECAM